MVGDSLGIFLRAATVGIFGTMIGVWSVLGLMMFLAAPFVFWIFVISELFGS